MAEYCRRDGSSVVNVKRRRMRRWLVDLVMWYVFVDDRFEESGNSDNSARS